MKGNRRLRPDGIGTHFNRRGSDFIYLILELNCVRLIPVSALNILPNV
ncbi:hypothetical protein GGC63_005299 [Paenibacillus sp. OAS669]|nr:hypothetical protein [Paenibacillus sp. OAS669]